MRLAAMTEMTPISLAWIVALLCWACGSDSARSRSADSGIDAVQERPDMEDPPAQPRVAPPQQARVELTLSPRRTFYRPGEAIQLLVRVVDEFGDTIPGVDTELRLDPAPQSLSLVGGLLTPEDEGSFSVLACIRGSEVCAHRPLVVNAGAPALELEQPLAGAQLGGPGLVWIDVIGSVADHRLSRVWVDGALVELDEMGRFSTRVAGELGVTHIEVVASDGILESETVARDVIWAADYLPVPDREGASEVAYLPVQRAIALRLGAELLDDGMQLDASSVPIVTRDLADIVELVAARLDLLGSLPDPLVDAAPTLLLSVESVDLGAAQVNLEVTQEGLELFLRLAEVDVQTAGQLDVDGSAVSLSGGIAAGLAALAQLKVDRVPESGDVRVTLESLDAVIESASGRFDSDQANAVFALAEGTLRSSLEGQLEGAFSGVVGDVLPGVIEGALGAVAGALAGQRVPLETGVFPSMDLLLDGAVDDLRRAPGRWLETSVEASVGTDQPALHGDSRGVSLFEAGQGLDGLLDQGGLQAGVRMPFLNGLLHALWNGGLLEVDVLPLLPADYATLVSRADLSGKLPPLLRVPRAGEGGQLRIAVGQLELELELLGFARYGVTIEAGVDVQVLQGRLTVQLGDEVDLTTWLIATDQSPVAVDAAALAEILRTQLWPQLKATLEQGLSVQLPSLGVDALGAISSDLEGFALNIETDGAPVYRAGSLRLPLLLRGTL